MTKKLQSEAIIVSTVPHGDNHLICHVLTQDAGMLHVYARHARTRKSRFSSGLEVCDRGRIEYSPPKNEGLANLHEFITISSYPGLRVQLDRMLCANFLCEVVNRILEEDSGDSEAPYSLMVAALESLSHQDALNEILKVAYKTTAYLLKLQGFDSRFYEQEAGSQKFLSLLSYLEENILASPLKTRTALEASIRHFVKQNQTQKG